MRPGFPTGRVLGWARRFGVEAWWWLAGAARLWWRYRIRASLLIAVVVACGLWGHRLAAVGLVVPVVGVGLWARLAPAGYRRWLADPLWRSRTRRRVRRGWAELMESVGLARRVPATTRKARKRGAVPVLPAELVQTPGLGRLRWDGDELVASPRLLTGQTVDDVDAATERLRVGLDADRCRIMPNPAATGCRIVWGFGDPLAEPFAATVPTRDEEAREVLESGSVPLGRGEDGRVWRLPLGLSTLTAGCSGAGKASLIWGLLFGLGPANWAGLVRLLGIDLKGGMELSMGAALFTSYARTAETAVVLLEDTAADLQARAARLAGTTRQHTPTGADPLVVVVIDELAALINYGPDRDLTRRAEAALAVILSQGRAVGFVVFAFLQDPRKETVRMRHLFTQAIGLRLRDREEVAMVLGDGAIAAGARCHKIPATAQGTGYVLGADHRPVRVRAGYVTDQMIQTAAARFPALVQVPIVVPELTEPASRARSSRSGRSIR